ncbi:unnamed protein product [Schistosoma curassoni]|uniref:Reverse transcriptase domain-containing protein n=1 Tax=Schistosoma curassoni TaxID=6186 RepID=A0A183KLF2_9TREM|nr:unnamed protein product [Schistosoma curassoni]
MTAEKAARGGNMRQLHDTTKKLPGNYRKPERPVERKEGKVITNIETALLNPPNIEAAPTDLPINVGPPTIDETSMAIRQIKSGKAAGPDNIPEEALKADVAIWDGGKVPTDWKERLLNKIPKECDLSKCENYRGITLLSIPGKVFNRVLLNRMKDSVDTQLRDQQAGFRKDRSCTDQIATLRIIVEQSIGWNSSLYINFIDYEEAFDNVDRTTLRKHLRYYGVPQKIVTIIRNFYDGLNCKIVHGGQLTNSFEVKTGVR